jgi:hypothetical protein
VVHKAPGSHAGAFFMGGMQRYVVNRSRVRNGLAHTDMKESIMWKILVGFILFAGLGLFMIFKGGDKVDMSGEKHETPSQTAVPAEAASAAK